MLDRDIDDLVDDWHEGVDGTAGTLAEYLNRELGMTSEEYVLWVGNAHAANHKFCNVRCFTAKLRYWRSQAHNPVLIPGSFHG